MLWALFLYLIFYIPYVSAADTSDDNDLTLDLIQVIFRHGLRTPLEEEARFINITDPSIYGYDFGQLTKRGRKQEYTLGKFLRKNYHWFLSTYDQKELVAISTNVSRTKESLVLVLSGLFSLTPMPNQFTFCVSNTILAPYANPKFTEIHTKILKNSKKFETDLSKYSDFIRYMGNQTGYSLFSIVNSTVHFQSLLKIHKLLNIALPIWYTKEVFETFRNMSRTHDLTLASFTRAQDVTGAFYMPPFGSAYVVESYKDSKQKRYIRMLKWNGTTDGFVELEINNCSKYCPVDTYKILVKDVIPTDEELKIFNPDTCESF
ncbi:testicular acid phosphatase homolog [Copidosoma floridanum]|uniref:testicular acid phosphatase homolog n=1 Tax=Copidosoma floridanum TaxID=29053 RepID=UPI0006C989BA|nr:testicular acid phosphatase homolog [Copidosoma floridanum]